MKSCSWTSEQKFDICIQMMKGLKFIHYRGVVHGNIRPENLLINERENRIIVKFGDFSGSRRSSLNEYSSETSENFEYSAPEVLMELPWNYKADCWSLACVIYELYVGARKLDVQVGKMF